MNDELFRPVWKDIDPTEMRIVLGDRFGFPGQFDGDRMTLHLPLAREACKVRVRYEGHAIVSVAPGSALTEPEWSETAREIDALLSTDATLFGREYSFSSFKVTGSWRGAGSGVQILPPHPEAPQPFIETGDHPFILELPVVEAASANVTKYRLARDHRRLTRLLNVLLVGHTTSQGRNGEGCWVQLHGEGEDPIKIVWGVPGFYAKLGGAPLITSPSPAGSQRIEEVDPETYYDIGHDGRPLPVAADLDEQIVTYRALTPGDRARFNRAAFWLDVSSRSWSFSVSSYFAALVSAIEALTERGETHSVHCDQCGRARTHDEPGATKLFRDFLETYAPGITRKAQRDEMYKLRSDLLHGTEIMHLDQELSLGFGMVPPFWREYDLFRDLSAVARVALRTWLKTRSTE